MANKCKDCGTELEPGVRVCPHCGKKKMNWLGCLATLIVFLGAAVIFFVVSHRSSEKMEAKDLQDAPYTTEAQAEALDSAIAQKQVKLNAKTHIMLVSEAYWTSLDAQEQEDLTRMAAVRMAQQLDIDIYKCDVLDMSSRNKIAEFTKSWGFKIL